MKFLRFKDEDEIKTAYLDEDKVVELKGNILDYFNVDIYKIKENIVQSHSLEDVEIATPIDPSKIVCIGLNYKDHAEEFNESFPDTPTLFIKPSTAVIANKEDILKPKESNRIDYEAELGVVIGKKCKDIEIEDTRDYIFGYTIVNDVTARDIQRHDGQWTRGKSFDTFAPIGPFIVDDLDPQNQIIQSKVDGELKQNSNTSNMFFSCYELVSFISKVMTLKPGDIIATGTPSGVGKMEPCSTVEIMVEDIGTLKNRLIDKK